MRKKGVSYSRHIIEDRLYKSQLISKLINNLMEDGKKNMAENIVYDALINVSKKLEKPVLEVFNKIIENVTPNKGVISRKIGGSNYQVPIEIDTKKGEKLAVKFIVRECRNIKKKSGQTTIEILSKIFEDAFNNTGAAVNIKIAQHSVADQNAAFSHYRW